VQCHVCSQSKQKESTSTAQPRAERFLPRSAAADNSFFPGKALGAVVSAISAAAVLVSTLCSTACNAAVEGHVLWEL
jgi:hypothetical protein